MLKFLKNQKGLTLVELLAVLVIVGVLAAIAVPTVGGMISDTKVKADEATEKLIEDAAERYLTIVLPNNGDTTERQAAGIANGRLTVARLQTEGYLREVPTQQSNADILYVDVKVDFNGNGWKASDVQ